MVQDQDQETPPWLYKRPWHRQAKNCIYSNNVSNNLVISLQIISYILHDENKRELKITCSQVQFPFFVIPLQLRRITTYKFKRQITKIHQIKTKKMLEKGKQNN